MTREAQSLLPELSPTMARLVEVYAGRIRDGLPLCDAVAAFSKNDEQHGQPARAAEWEARLVQAAKAHTPPHGQQIHRQDQQMAPRMKLER